MCAMQPYTSLQCRFIQNHIGKVHVCLAITCHLHFWQNGRDLLCTTAVSRLGVRMEVVGNEGGGWGGTDTDCKSQR